MCKAEYIYPLNKYLKSGDGGVNYCEPSRRHSIEVKCVQVRKIIFSKEFYFKTSYSEGLLLKKFYPKGSLFRKICPEGSLFQKTE